MNYNTLKTELEQIIRNFKKYAPVVAVSLLLLTQVAAAGFIFTQPLGEDSSGSVIGQTTNETVYISSQRGYVRSVDSGSGNQIWNNDLGGSIEEIVKDPNNDVIYATDTDNSKLYKINSNDGSVIWEVTTSDSAWGIDILPDGSSVIVGTFDGKIEKYDSSGNLEDSYVIDPSLTGQIQALEVSENGSSFGYAHYSISGGDWAYTLANTTDLQPKWTTVTGNEVVDTAVSSESEIAYAGGNNNVDSQGLDYASGNVEYTNPEPGLTTILAKDSNTVYSSDFDSNLEAYNITDGTQQFSYPVSGNVVGMSLSSKNGEIYYTTTATAYTLDTQTGSTTSIYSSPEITDIETNTVPIAAQPATEFDPELKIETRNYIKHGNAAAYEVYYTNPETGETTLVNGESGLTLNSSNTSVFTVNEANETLDATEDTSINQREQFTAEYEGLKQSENVTVANQTVENLPILPGITRVGATYSDSNIALILVGTLLGVVATRVSSAFAGIGALQLTLVAGFFVDLVSLGVVLVGLFAALFIGLNLAANIDYAVSR